MRVSTCSSLTGGFPDIAVFLLVAISTGTSISKLQGTLHNQLAFGSSLNYDLHLRLQFHQIDLLPGSSIWDKSHCIAASTPEFEVLTTAFTQRTRGKPISVSWETTASSTTGPSWFLSSESQCNHHLREHFVQRIQKWAFIWELPVSSGRSSSFGCNPLLRRWLMSRVSGTSTKTSGIVEMMLT